jgi:hypothetical protein
MIAISANRPSPLTNRNTLEKRLEQVKGQINNMAQTDLIAALELLEQNLYPERTAQRL